MFQQTPSDVTSPDAPSVRRACVSHSPQALFLKSFFGLFASATRAQVFFLVQSRRGNLCVSEIAQEMNVCPQTVSNHLSRLREMGIVEARAHGCYRFYHIRWQAFEQAYGQLGLLPSENGPQEVGGDPSPGLGSLHHPSDVEARAVSLQEGSHRC